MGWNSDLPGNKYFKAEFINSNCKSNLAQYLDINRRNLQINSSGQLECAAPLNRLFNEHLFFLEVKSVGNFLC